MPCHTKLQREITIMVYVSSPARNALLQATPEKSPLLIYAHISRSPLMSCFSCGNFLHNSEMPDIYRVGFYPSRWSGGYFWRWISSRRACQVRGDKSYRLSSDKSEVWVRVKIPWKAPCLLWYGLFDRTVMSSNSFSFDGESWSRTRSLSIGAVIWFYFLRTVDAWADIFVRESGV